MEERNDGQISEEQKKQLRESPYNTPEHYAQYYLLPPEDVELFEKIKVLHDHCQLYDIPMATFVFFPKSGRPDCFFHLTSDFSERQQSIAHGRFELLIGLIARWVKGSSQGFIEIIKKMA